MPRKHEKHDKQPALDSGFTLQPRAHWYEYPPLPAASTPVRTPTPAELSDLLARGSALHAFALNNLSKANGSSSKNAAPSEAGFLDNIAHTGTLSDRLSALTLLVQSSPAHHTKALETLKGMVERGKGKGGREESLKALRCIVDWWVGGGAPTRKLRYFRDQPLLHPDVTDEHLALWYFEDWLKKYFFSLLQIIESLSLDPLVYVRTQTLTFLATLLREKPEQEHNLLRLLVNKLGDNERSVCSRTSYYLLQLLQAHPSMKSVVVKEIAALLFRPSTAPSAPTSTPNKHIRFNDSGTATSSKPKTSSAPKSIGNVHASYYATITLNQIVLSHSKEDQLVARQLLDMYFDLFRDVLQDYGNNEDNGGSEGDEVKPGTESSSKTSGKVPRGKGKKASKTSEKEDSAFTEIEDSNSRHISAILSGVNRALPFSHLTPSDVSFHKRVDTLFLITHKSTFNISLQALLLILQISTTLSASSNGQHAVSEITDRYYRTLYASLHDPRLATSSKQAMYLNLIFKSLKADSNLERVTAFVRRFVQTLGSGAGGGTEFTAGGLYLLGELFSTITGLRSSVLKGKSKSEGNMEEYDPKKREPQFAHASSSPMWELTPLLHHYHPTIALHARQLLLSQPLTATPDLSLNTLSHFLDRFVYKNPKKSKQQKGASAMQPGATPADGTGVKLFKGEAQDAVGLMNDPALLRRKPQDVPVDQLFFYKYFTRKNEMEKRSHVKDGEDAEDLDDELSANSDHSDEDDLPVIDSEDDEIEEKEIWKAMKATMPRAEDEDELPEDMSDNSNISDEPEFGSELSGPSDDELDDEEDKEEQISENDDDGDDLSLAEASDADDLIGLDEEIEVGLIDAQASGSESEEQEWGGIDNDESTSKRKRASNSGKQENPRKKRKLRSLPTFASYEDYAKLIEDGPEDFI